MGAFPGGASPHGVLDLSGNVFEWCQSLAADYPYQADDGREDLESEGDRVLRGGSWNVFEDLARCACRCRGGPLYRIDDVGYRVVISPALPASGS